MSKHDNSKSDNIISPDHFLFILSEYDSLAAESIRALRTNLILRDFEKKIKIINITSVTPSEGKTTVLVNLAAAFTQLNKKVLLIDCDLRLPDVHKKLGLRNKYGIVDVVSNFKSFDETVYHYMDNFDVLTTGTDIPFASEFIQSAALRRFIESCRLKYDYIFIDCSPIAYISDAHVISKFSDGTLMIVAVDSDNRQDLKEVNEQLHELDINILGLVMTKIPLDKYPYSYASRYKYNYYRGEKMKVND